MARGKKKKTATADELFVSIAKFDTRIPVVREVFSNVPIAEARGITQGDYSPMGGTPLNDAVLEFATQLDSNLRANPNALHVGLLADESGSMAHLRNDVIEGFNTFIDEVRSDDSKGGEPGVIMVIMTDGLENSSKEDPKGDKVKEVIKQKEADGWNFFYLGANQDAWSAGADLGLGRGAVSMNFAATSEGTRESFSNAALLTNTRSSTTSKDYAGASAQALAGVMTYDEDEDVGE